MATVTPNLTLASSADTATSEGTWAGGSGVADTEVKIQGSGSYNWQAGKNARTIATFTPTTNLDMSGTDVHLYWWAQCSVAAFIEPFIETADAPGYTMRLTDGSANYKEWRIAGSDTWGGEWKVFVQDISSTTNVYASSGTLILSDIDVISWSIDMSNSGNIRIIKNQWNDVVRFGTGLTLTSTTTEDFALTDIAAIDDSSTNKYGILRLIDGVLFCQGKLTIGDTTNTTNLVSGSETLYFLDRPVSTSLYGITGVAGAANATNIDISGLVTKTVGTHRAKIDLSDTDLGTVDIDGSTFLSMGTIDFESGAAVTSNKFDNCGQIDPSTCAFEDNTVSNYVGTEGGALLWPGGTATKSCIFINNDEAIEIASGATQTFDGHIFDDVSGKYDVNNTTGSTVTVSKTGNSNPNSYTGSLVTFTASFTHELTDLVENTEVTYVLQSSGNEVYHVEDVGVGGTTSYTHSGGELVDILIFHVEKLPGISDIYDITLPNGDATVKVSQFDDPNYVNP